jgi:UDP-glucose 4-epimerase
VLDIVGVLAGLHGPSAPQPEFAPARLGEIERSCLDASRARDALGWSSQTPIAEGLKLTYDALGDT